MSQTTEVSEKCDDLQILEQSLARLKKVGDSIQKTYEDTKRRHEDILKKDKNSEENKRDIHETLQLLKDSCKKYAKVLKNLERKGLKSVSISETNSDNSIRDKTPTDNHNDDEGLINGEKSSDDDNLPSPLSKKGKKQKRKKDESNSLDNHDSKEDERQAVSEEDDNSNKTDQTNRCTENIQKENLDKENKKPEENGSEQITPKEGGEMEPPKALIRLVSLDKLLDPNIAALQKKGPEKETQNSNYLNSSGVIILDSDDEDSSKPISRQNDEETKQNRVPNKIIIKRTKSGETRIINKPNDESKVKEYDKKNNKEKKNGKSNPKMTGISIKIKSNSLIKEMLKHEKYKIKLTEDLVKDIEGPIDKELFNKLTSKAEIEKDEESKKSTIKSRNRFSSEQRRELLLSSEAEEENDNANARRKLNVKLN